MLTESQIESIQVTRLVPGDVLVIKCSQALSATARQRVADQVQGLIPDGVRAMVLDGGMDMEVLRKSRADTLLDPVIAGIRNGGPLAQALQAQYGLQRLGE